MGERERAERERERESGGSGVGFRRVEGDKIDHQLLIKSLHAFRCVHALDIKKGRWEPTEEGMHMLLHIHLKYIFFLAIPLDGIPPTELKDVISNLAYGTNEKLVPSVSNMKVYQACLSPAKLSGWIEPGKELLTRKTERVQDAVKDLLVRVQGGEPGEVPKEIAELKKRNLVTIK